MAYHTSTTRIRAAAVVAVLMSMALLNGCSLLFPEEADLVGVQIELKGFGGNFVWVVLEGDLVMHAKLDSTVSVVGSEATTLTYTERGLRWLDVQWDQTRNPVRPNQYRTQMSLDKEERYFVMIDGSDPENPSITVQTGPFSSQ